MAVIQLHLDKNYHPSIIGLGEVYEIISVEYKKEKLKEKFKKGIMYLSSNSYHQGRGISMKDLEKMVMKNKFKILDKGYVDSPPWCSNPRKANQKSIFLEYPPLIFFVKIVFRFLVRLEFLWQGETNSHMVYVLGKQ